MSLSKTLRPLVASLVVTVAALQLPGCGDESDRSPAMGTEEFNKAKEEYKNIRRKEYQRDTLEPTTKKKGG